MQEEQKEKPYKVMFRPNEVYVGCAPHMGILWIHSEDTQEKVSIGISHEQIDDFLLQIEEAKKQIANPSF